MVCILQAPFQRSGCCVNQTFETPQAAIKHIAKCYAIDKDIGQLGEYYYFMKKH